MVTYLDGHSHMILKPLNFQYRSANEHQTWQSDEFPWGTLTYKSNDSWARGLGRLKHYISTTRVFIATKRGWLVTYFNGLLLIKSHDALIM